LELWILGLFDRLVTGPSPEREHGSVWAASILSMFLPYDYSTSCNAKFSELYVRGLAGSRNIETLAE
jgi:hypothetical protein